MALTRIQKKFNAQKVQTIINYFNHQKFNISNYKLIDVKQIPIDIRTKFPDKIDTKELLGKFNFHQNTIKPLSIGDGNSCFEYAEATDWWWDPDGDDDPCHCSGNETYAYTTYSYVTVCIGGGGYGGVTLGWLGGASTGGGGLIDPYSQENLDQYAQSLGYYWEDPSYDENSTTFPPYDPAVDGPYDSQGYRKNGPSYQYVGGTVQIYTNDNGGKYAIFTSTNGISITFPGATITDFGVLSRAGVTTANGGIHMSTTGNGLEDLEHEYGHYLQAQQLGTAYYYHVIVPASLYSAATDPSNHRFFWTEKNANNLSSAFFGPNSAIATSTYYPK